MAVNERLVMARCLTNIQALRAVAALLVVMFHAQEELSHRNFRDPLPSLKVGAFGVDLFFVISGFIMVYASREMFGHGHCWREFMRRRLVRVVPLYWMMSAVSALIMVVLSRYPGHPDYSVPYMLQSFLFIPVARPGDGAILPVDPVDPVGWSLDFEMFFYLCFAVVIVLRRSAAVAAIATGMTLFCIAGMTGRLPMPLAYLADPISLEFIFGVLLADAYLKGWRIPMAVGLPMLALCAAAVWLAVPLLDALPLCRGLVWGLPGSGIVAALALAPTDYRWPGRTAAVALGDASYSLYLVHSPVFIGLYAGASRLIDLQRVPALLYWAVLSLASVAAAFASFHLIERPIFRLLRGRPLKLPAPLPPDSPAASA